jgi:ADP-heptose:LPS heptosyltransferase
MSTIQINHTRERIGDFLGSLPALQFLAQTNDVKIVINPVLKDLFNYSGLTEGINEKPDKIYTINLDHAYAQGWDHNLHMTQAYFGQLGLPIPEKPIRPALNIPYLDVPIFDYVLCPYSVSLSWGHLWTIEKWNALVKSLPHAKIAVLGSLTDERLKAQKNLTSFYGESWLKVSNILRNAKCVISVVSGLSHLTHALGAPHVLMINQPKWAQNPDAKAQITNYLINEIPLKTVLDVLSLVSDGKQVGNIGHGNYIQ